MLSLKQPAKVAADVNAILRANLHDKPRRGAYVRRGRRKLAANLIAVNFKKASTRIIE